MRVGIDVGTTVTKAALFDHDGALRDVRSSRTTLLRPGPGRFEYDVAQVVECVLALLEDLPGRREVDLVAVTGQGDGLWLLDEQGDAVRPAMAWLDNRGSAACQEWTDSGAASVIFGRTANAAFPGAGAALLAGLDRAEPGSLDAARTATQCQHAIFERLTGVRTATRSCAMLPVFNPSTGDYDENALRAAGLPHRRDLLPPIDGGDACLAPMRGALADRLGLARGTLVATGPYDLPAAALGAGSLAPGDGLLIVGTTLACQVRHDTVAGGVDAVGLTLCTGDGAGWLRAMPAMVGTAGLDWVLRMVSATHADLGALLAGSAAGAGGVLALPYLSPAGERAPFADPDARAEFCGLSLDSEPADLVRALCESLAYAARHCFEAAGLTGEVTVCGGAATSAELMAIFADVLDRPLRLAAAAEPAARGAVSAAAGVLGRAAPVDRGTSRAPRIEPRANNRAVYADGYADYVSRVAVARRHRWRRAAPTPQPPRNPRTALE